MTRRQHLAEWRAKDSTQRALAGLVLLVVMWCMGGERAATVLAFCAICARAWTMPSGPDSAPAKSAPRAAKLPQMTAVVFARLLLFASLSAVLGLAADLAAGELAAVLMASASSCGWSALYLRQVVST